MELYVFSMNLSVNNLMKKKKDKKNQLNVEFSKLIKILVVFRRDLSNTSIESMPHSGLEKLEILRIQNTHTLKTIPSVYAFQVSIVVDID